MDPQIHLIDETWIAAPVAQIAARVADPASWAHWWPGLDLSIKRDRGLKGMQWNASGVLQGTTEIWLEPFSDGVILHHFVRLDPAAGARWSARKVSRTTRDLSWHSKRVFWALKDELESAEARIVNTSAVTPAQAGNTLFPQRR